MDQFEFLEIKINKVAREKDIKLEIKGGGSAIILLNGVLWVKSIFKETNIQIHRSIIQIIKNRNNFLRYCSKHSKLARFGNLAKNRQERFNF